MCACLSKCMCVCLEQSDCPQGSSPHQNRAEQQLTSCPPRSKQHVVSSILSISLCSSFLSHPLLFPLLQPFFKIIFTLFFLKKSLFVPQHRYTMSLSFRDSFSSSPPLLSFYFFGTYRCTSLLFSHLLPTVFIQSILSTPPLHNYKSSLDKALVFPFS